MHDAHAHEATSHPLTAGGHANDGGSACSGDGSEGSGVGESAHAQRLAAVLTAIHAELRLLLTPHVSAKSLAGLGDALRYLGHPESIRRLLLEPACRQELARMAETLRGMYGLGSPRRLRSQRSSSTVTADI